MTDHADAAARGHAAITELCGRLEAAQREIRALREHMALREGVQAVAIVDATRLPSDVIARVQALIGDVRLRADESAALAMVLGVSAQASAPASRAWIDPTEEG